MDEREREELHEDVLVLAHDVAVFVFIVGLVGGVPGLLAVLHVSPWLTLPLAIVFTVLFGIPMVVLRAHQPRDRPGPWPTDVHGREVGRWYDQLGLDQRKPRAALTGVPDEPWQRKVLIGRNDPCPCGSGERFKVCCAHRGWRHFWWQHGGKYGLYEPED